jgi:hypothetical protein
VLFVLTILLGGTRVPECLYCRKATLGTNLCAWCANTVPSDRINWSKVKTDTYESRGPGRVATELKLKVDFEPSSKIQLSGHSMLAKNMGAWIAPMCIYLDSREWWNAKEETSFGDQHTPNSCKSGTVSLDFQGIRSGSNQTHWIDLQGQVGGGSTDRLSYCQVMIQTCLGGPVSQDLIAKALLQSLKDGAVRAIIHKEGETGKPK